MCDGGRTAVDGQRHAKMMASRCPSCSYQHHRLSCRWHRQVTVLGRDEGGSCHLLHQAVATTAGKAACASPHLGPRSCHLHNSRQSSLCFTSLGSTVLSSAQRQGKRPVVHLTWAHIPAVWSGHRLTPLQLPVQGALGDAKALGFAWVKLAHYVWQLADVAGRVWMLQQMVLQRVARP